MVKHPLFLFVWCALVFVWVGLAVSAVQASDLVPMVHAEQSRFNVSGTDPSLALVLVGAFGILIALVSGLLLWRSMKIPRTS